jgi:parallel beta-helix repeat protein
MKFNKKQLVVLLIFGFVFPLIANYSSTPKDQNTTNSISPRLSADYIVSFIHIDGSITNNWSDTLAEPWCSFINGRYVIENVTIDATGSDRGYGILVNNSINERFIIRNCIIVNARHSFFDSGIKLENTNNGTLINNNCSENYQGIYLTNAVGNNITENIVNSNNINGIYLDGNCHDNIVTENTVSYNIHYGIQLVGDCDHNNITLNTVTKSGEYGIFFNSFGGSSDNNIIFNNTAKENDKYGIFLRYDNYDNVIFNNTASENTEYGICLQTCHDVSVYGNIIQNNKRGILLQGCDNGNVNHNTINNNEIGIYLYFNSDGNQIKNNTIDQNELGIALYQSDMNNITGNSLIGNSRCIIEIYSNGNIIKYNDCSTPTLDAPIFINGAATGVGAHNWTWVEQQSWFGGGLGTKESPYVIENLKISGFGISNLNCIDIVNSNAYLIIRGCQIFNAGSGISFQGVNHTLIIENNCSNNRYNGIYLGEGSCYNNITYNTCYESNSGIDLYLNSNYNRIINNTLTYNEDGIYMEANCNHTIILGNTANNNTNTGIHMYQSNHNTITDNIASFNYNNGIFMEEDCDSNVISDNLFNQNNLGIELYYSDFNNITDNSVFNNSYSGIEIEVGNFNEIIGNIVANNTEYGLYIESNSNNNSIYKNYFLTNGLHAYDDGTDNKWNSTVIGNYWDNHTGPDANKDGIVDVPYTYIGGSAGSIDYLPIAPAPPLIHPSGFDPALLAFIITMSIIAIVAVIAVIFVILNRQGKISLDRLKSPFKKE